jgi:hypothetical protein
MFSEGDLDLFLEEFGIDIPVTLNGVAVEPVRGIVQSEVITDSPNEAEIGTSLLTMQIKASAYAALDRTKKYVFVVDSVNNITYGPGEKDGSGFIKFKLKKV